ncbi:MAG: Nramp family divalent metal transporter [Pirellulaceae bacterium]
MQASNANISREGVDRTIPEDGIKEPPTDFATKLTHLGPGLIISAAIVGSGELIVTTVLGAEVGFTLLWFIILGCLVKVFVQIELGRYTLTHGKTTIAAMDDVPGPRLVLGWMVYAWILMYVATFFQLSGIVSAIAQVFRLSGSTLPDWLLAALVTGSCAVLLAGGRYWLIERVSTVMVALFTLMTVAAVGALAWTEYALGWAQIMEGLSFSMPRDDTGNVNFTVAFAAFGIIGVGASELIYYPYWCLEKGYAKYVGPRDESESWAHRAQGWMRILKLDAWISMVIYTLATVAFYLLGAAVLHQSESEINDGNLIVELSRMYRESFGGIGLYAFIVGAFVVLYSTVFISTASNARLFADLLGLTGIIELNHEKSRARWIKVSCILLPALYFLIYVLLEKPLLLVFIGALAQSIMLPLLCGASLYFHHRRTHPALQPSTLWTAFLWISSLLMAGTGVYQLYSKLLG